MSTVAESLSAVRLGEPQAHRNPSVVPLVWRASRSKASSWLPGSTKSPTRARVPSTVTPYSSATSRVSPMLSTPVPVTLLLSAPVVTATCW